MTVTPRIEQSSMHSPPSSEILAQEDQSQWQVQLSQDGSTVWVHALDGSTVGRFSKRFGLDVHTTVTEQLEGAGQCIHCTHEPATESDWQLFCLKINEHHGINVDSQLVQF